MFAKMSASYTNLCSHTVLQRRDDESWDGWTTVSNFCGRSVSAGATSLPCEPSDLEFVIHNLQFSRSQLSLFSVRLEFFTVKA